MALNTNKLRPLWKTFDNDTHILTVDGIDITVIELNDNGKPEIYFYDSPFLPLFQSVAGNYEFSTVDECKNKVENIFTGWISRVLGILSNVN